MNRNVKIGLGVAALILVLAAVWAVKTLLTEIGFWALLLVVVVALGAGAVQHLRSKMKG